MRLLSRVLVTLVLLPSIALAALEATAPPTLSGIAYATAFVLLGAASLWQDPVRRSRIRAFAGVLAGVTALLRIVVASGSGESARVRMATPGSAASGARIIDRVIDEEDLSVNASRALAWTGFIRDPDVPGLAAIMSASYREMRRDVGSSPSPVLATYAGLEAPGSDDTIEMGDVEHGEGVVVFLHGFAGSFTLPCWVVARAAAPAGFATVCPSTRWVGDWWSADGEATLRETLASLRARGARRFVLAGLSNGGIGASLLMPRLRGAGVEALVLVSGASPEAGAPGVPVLVVQGERDAQVSASVVRAYAERVHAGYVSLDAGHFALLTRRDRATSAITSFLRSLPPASPAASRASARELAATRP
jgi:hypothetical protein